MPAIPAKYDVNDKAINSAGDDERKARIDYIRSRWARYEGDHPRPLKVRPGDRDDNIILNPSGKAVDRMVASIKMPVRFEVPGGSDIEPTPEADGGDVTEIVTDVQAMVNQTWDEIRPIMGDLMLSCQVAGHVFVKLVDDEDGVSAELLDPRHVTVFYDQRKPRRRLFYRMEWKFGRDEYRQDIVPVWLREGGSRPDGSDLWDVIEYEKRLTGTPGWSLVSEERWKICPVVDWPAARLPHQYYGRSMLNRPGLNDSINFIASNTGRIIKFHAHPRTIARGVAADQIEQTAIDGMWTVPAESSIENLEMQSDLESSMRMLDRLERNYYSELNVVDPSTFGDKLGKITNFGIRVLYADQIDEVQKKRDDFYGPGLAEVIRRLVWLKGANIDAPLMAVWPDPLPKDEMELVQRASAEKALGTTSLQTLAETIGRDYATEVERQIDERLQARERQLDQSEFEATRGLMPNG